MKNWLNQYTLKIKLNKIPDLSLQEYLEGIRKSLELERVESKITSENQIYFNDVAPWYKKSNGSATIGIKGHVTLARDEKYLRITYDHHFIFQYLIALVTFFIFVYLTGWNLSFYLVSLFFISLLLWWRFFAFNSILIGGIHHHT